MISLKDVSFAYKNGRVLADKSCRALDGVSLEINKGEHVALVGPNGSGKTTLARVLDALLIPDEGDCVVDGINTRDDPVYARRSVGMVFQDPESQAVARHVRDDVAFGPRNLGCAEGEVEARVAEALEAVGMDGLIGREVSGLSGGQKQLLAIAGILAMRPSYVVLDEPAALLDGRGAGLVRDALARIEGVGTVTITHDMDEASRAGRVIALSGGRIVADMAPGDFFSDRALMATIGVEPPFSVRLAKAAGPFLSSEVYRIWR